MFGIKHKSTNQYFAGFTKNEVLWTDDENQAWTSPNKQHVKTQALLLVAQGIKVQHKPIYFQEG